VLIAQGVFFLECRRIHKATDTTDHLSHASAMAVWGPK